MRWIILQKSETEVKVKNLPDLTEYVEKVEFISLKRVKKTGCVKWWVSNTTLQRPLECEKHHQIPSVWAEFIWWRFWNCLSLHINVKERIKISDNRITTATLFHLPTNINKIRSDFIILEHHEHTNPEHPEGGLWTFIRICFQIAVSFLMWMKNKPTSLIGFFAGCLSISYVTFMFLNSDDVAHEQPCLYMTFNLLLLRWFCVPMRQKHSPRTLSWHGRQKRLVRAEISIIIRVPRHLHYRKYCQNLI